MSLPTTTPYELPQSPISATVPFSPQPGAAAPSPILDSTPPVAASVAAVFSEYRDFDTHTYYDLPLGTSDDPHDLRFWSVPDADSPSHALVSAIEFSNPLLVGAILIMQVTLWAGKKAVVARALVDSGSDGDFIDLKFEESNGFSLLRRKYLIKASGFDSTPSASGLCCYYTALNPSTVAKTK